MVRWACKVGLQFEPAKRLRNNVPAKSSREIELASWQIWKSSGEKVSKRISLLSVMLHIRKYL